MIRHALLTTLTSLSLTVSPVLLRTPWTTTHLATPWAKPLLTPAQWTTAHDHWTNNAVLAPDPEPSVSPQYTIDTPMLMSSAPVVVQGRVVITTSAAPSRRHPIRPGAVLAFQARTGRLLWRTRFPNALDSQPIVTAGRVIVGMGNATFIGHGRFPTVTTQRTTRRGTGPSGLFALSLTTGHLLWHIPTLGSDQPTPTLWHGTLYEATGARALLAINPQTGQVRWRLALPAYVSRSSPRIANDQLYLGGGGPESVFDIDLHTHRLRWITRLPQALGGADDTPLAYAGNTLVGEILQGSPTAPPAAPHTQSLFALNATTGHLRWIVPIATGAEPRYKQGATPTIAGATVYAGTVLQARLVAFQWTTGHRLWQRAMPGLVTRPPLVWGNHLVVVTTHGTLLTYTRQGIRLHSQSLGQWTNAFAPIILYHTLWISGNTAQAGRLHAEPLARIVPTPPERT